MISLKLLAGFDFISELCSEFVYILGKSQEHLFASHGAKAIYFLRLFSGQKPDAQI